MTEVLKEIDYKKVFHFFEEISNVPRGSRHNEGISNYLVQFAKERGLSYMQDEMFNVIIKKEASKGYEDKPAVILQGHMDMVCLKEQDSKHDFTKDPLRLKIDGDYISAEETTLGGDDGIAVAYALAILDSDEIIHPPLEVVITTDEEIGLLGATALDTSLLTGKYMLNLDSEEESSILVGCAGGMTAISEFHVEREKVSGTKIKLCICGLLGGHSGCDIEKNRTNATLLAARMLSSLKEIGYVVYEMESGEKDNAIPNVAKISVVVAEDKADAFLEKVNELQKIYEKELQTSEPNFTIIASKDGQAALPCITKECFERFLLYIAFVPNGIQRMSADIKGLVESSLNLGICKITDDKAVFSYSVRSSVATYKEYMSEKIKTFTRHLGGEYRVEGAYPAWEYKQNSRLRDICIEVYKEEFKREPIIETIHAGLECGILSAGMPELDIISIGPDMHDVHTTKERLSISSTIRVFDFVLKVLHKLCE